MTRARRVFYLWSALSGLGAAVTGLALFAALTSVRWALPAPAALLEACRTLALPDIDVVAALALLLGSGALAVLILAGRSLRRQVRDARRFLGRLDVIGPVQVDAGPIVLFRDEAPQAFCAGALRPRVYVSTGAASVLRPRELQAVLAHERHHVRQRDPLRVLVARAASDALFFVPGMRQVTERYTALAEIAADTAAVRAQGGDRRALAAALLAFDGERNSTVVGIAPERVDSLVGDPPTWQLPVALLVGAGVSLIAVGAIAVRLAMAASQVAVDLPLVTAQACMLVMAVAPLLAGAGGILGSRRLFRMRRLEAAGRRP